MISKNISINPFQKLIESFPKRTKNQNMCLNPEELNFPELSEKYLCEKSFGSYQLKQSMSYTLDHLSDDGKYEFGIFKEKENLIRIKINSRHSSQCVYSVWIEYTNSLIKNYYCTCKTGARTVGCCSHVCCILWYLGYHLKYNKGKPFKTKSKNYLENCVFDAKLSENPEIISDDE